jgi:hypothetical protein
LAIPIPYTHRISLTLALWVGKKSCDETSNPIEIEKWVKLARGGYIIIQKDFKVCFIANYYG